MTQDLETGFAEFGVKVCGGEEPSHALYAYDPDGRMLGVYTDAGAEAFLALLRSIRRPPVVGGELREKVARIIDEHAFTVWQRMHDYCIRQGDQPEEANATADRFHKAAIETALAKASKILSLPGIAAGEGWRPIETAPKDGTDVLIWNAEGHEIAQWYPKEEDGSDQPGHDEGWIGTYAFPGRSWGLRLRSEPQGQPTHWMPLPQPPSPIPNKEDGR